MFTSPEREDLFGFWEKGRRLLVFANMIFLFFLFADLDYSNAVDFVQIPVV